MSGFVALLRGINVGGHRKVPMAELRELCEAIGWDEVRTYIQSGNVVFSAAGKGRAHEAALEQAIERRFGFPVDVIVRSGAELSRHAAANPFLEASEKEPNRVMLFLSKKKPLKGAAEALQERAWEGIRSAEAGGALWVHVAKPDWTFASIP